MEKKITYVLLLSCLIFLCGCGAVRDQLERYFWELSGVGSDTDYLQYKKMESEDLLNTDGTYHSETVDNYLRDIQNTPEGTIHVSFARNDHIQIDYYLDPDLTERIEGGNCWLNPGDMIYASEPVVNNSDSELYQFSEFRIWTHDAAGRLRSISVLEHELPGLVWQIPEDFEGTELSILPLGDYRSHKVTLRGGTSGRDGSFRVLELGVWLINGQRFGNVTAELDAMGSSHIVYDYAAYSDDWYFLRSDPEPYWEKPGDSTITFITDPADPEFMNYTVWLHPYGTLTVRNAVTYQNTLESLLDSAASMFGNKSIIETQNILDLIQVNGIPVVNNFSDTEVVLEKLKAGDEILIRIPDSLKLTSDGLTLPESIFSEAGREYRFMIPDTDDMLFTLDVGLRNMSDDGVFPVLSAMNAVVHVYDSLGLEYTPGSELPAENERVTVEIVPDEGNCIYGRGIKDNVYRAEMKYTEFIAEYQNILISHPVRPGIMVTIDTADELGDCVFWTGNEMISGEVMLREGQDLQFDYLLNSNSGFEITLTEQEKRELVSVWSPYAATRELNVTSDLDGKTLRCRDFVTLTEGVKTDDFENFD